MGTEMGFDMGSAEVYVLDLYRQRKWKRCASMQRRRLNFGCGVLDGKIYVFGGSHFEETFRESEVYDPEVDTWFPIKSLPSMRAYHQVATVGGGLFVYGGYYHEEISAGGEDVDPRLVMRDPLGEALFLEVYNPGSDEWRRIEPFKSGAHEGVFVAYGKLHSITQLAIHVYDIEEDSWTLLHTCSFAAVGPTDSVTVEPLGTVAVDGELLVRVCWYNGDDLTQGSCLLQSKGFGSESKEIVWKKAEGSDSFRGLSTPRTDFMALLEL